MMLHSELYWRWVTEMVDAKIYWFYLVPVFFPDNTTCIGFNSMDNGISTCTSPEFIQVYNIPLILPPPEAVLKKIQLF